MKFYSTNNPSHLVSLQEAVTNGLAPDNGLYMPDKIPTLGDKFIDSLSLKSFLEISFEVAKVFVGDDLSSEQLKNIISQTLTFDAPLVEIEPDVYALELFHGPTLAFKDFGARFMSQVLGHFAQQRNRETVILVATSGDTGSAVANGFFGIPGTRVVVLYPSGRVSERQEKQFTTLGKNILALEIKGTFDDCQRLVKLAFQDAQLKEKFFLSSANSINVARLIPQTFYYFYAWSRLPKGNDSVFSVPSGNFGNLTAGLIAKRMGLPISHFIAATNSNNIVPQYLDTGEFTPRSSLSTISNAMDVGNPSNFVRMLDLFKNGPVEMNTEISGYSFDDDQTRATMRKTFREKNYMLDPHGAIGYMGLREYQLRNSSTVGVFLETAHPAKFNDVIEPVLQINIPVPDRLKSFLSQNKKTIACNADFISFKSLLLHILS